MKKKLLLLALIILCAVACAIGLAACDNDNNDECQHDFVQKTFHSPTCTEGSYYDEECSKCGETRKGREIQPASGHGRTSSTYNNDETCTKNGTRTYKCIKCNETVTEEVPDSAMHKFEDSPNCIHCGKAAGNKSLNFTLNPEGDGYIVDGTVSALDGTLIDRDMRVVSIPAEYEGKPVVAIKKGYRDSITHTVYIPASVKEIYDHAFANSAIRKVVIAQDSQLKSIGYGAFSYTKITELTLPDGLTDTPGLQNMDYLTCLTLPESLQVSLDLRGHERLNTIINKSNTPISDKDIRSYFGLKDTDPLPSHFAVRETNPNRTIAVDCKGMNPTSKSEFDCTAYLNYIHLDGENILTGIILESRYLFGDNRVTELEIPYGITQVDSSALTTSRVDTLKLPDSVHSINKVNGFALSGWKEISCGEFTEISGFAENDFIKNEKSIIEYRKVEKPASGTIEFNFAELWTAFKANGYKFEKGGVTVSFETSDEDLTRFGVYSSESVNEPASVGFNVKNLVITMSLADGDSRTAQAISLVGHNSSGRPGYGVKVNGYYYDTEEDAFKSAHSEHTFSSTNFSFTSVEFDFTKPLGGGDWKYELSDSGNYGYKLLSLKITLQTLFNADLTEKV